MPSDTRLHREIETLKAAAIANTVTIPDIPFDVEAAAMDMDYEEACVFMQKYGYPIQGMRDSLVDLRIRRQPPRSNWTLTLGRCCQRGEFIWQLNAHCHRVPGPSDRIFLSSITRRLGIPTGHPNSTNEHLPVVLRQQHFVWMWAEPELN